MLAQASHDPDVGFCATLVLDGSEQVRAGGLDSPLGKGASLGEHAPRFETTGNLEVVGCVFWTAVDKRRLQGGDHFFLFALAGANCGDLLHPLRIAVSELIDMFVVGGGIVDRKS